MSTSSIGSVSGNSTLQQLEALYQKMEAKLDASTTSTASTTGAAGTASTAATDTNSVSGIGKLLSRLQDLATSDPSKFKQETAAIATKLSDAASKATGDEASSLQDLADQFKQASDTGDASALAPKHHAPQSHAASGSKTASSADQYSSVNLMSLLNTDATTTSDYLSSSQQTLLNNLFGSSSD